MKGPVQARLAAQGEMGQDPTREIPLTLLNVLLKVLAQFGPLQSLPLRCGNLESQI